jgi:hypothetical protein
MNNKSWLYALVGLIGTGAFLAAWFFSAPAAGAGWCLFGAIIVTIGICQRLSINTTPFFVTTGVLTLGYLATWFFGQALQHSGWVLFGAVISGIFLLQGLGRSGSSSSS